MNRRTGMNEQDVTGQAQTLDRALGTSQEGTGKKAQNQAPPLIPADMESIWQKCSLIHN